MYLALAEELKAYKDKNQFLEKEIKEMRAKNQELRVHLVNTDEQMELMYAHYKTHAAQNQFLKSELKKMQAGSSNFPMSLTPSPTSLSPSTELPALEELPENLSLGNENLENNTTEREVLPIDAPMSEPIFESISEEPLNETINKKMSHLILGSVILLSKDGRLLFLHTINRNRFSSGEVSWRYFHFVTVHFGRRSPNF